MNDTWAVQGETTFASGAEAGRALSLEGQWPRGSPSSTKS